MKRNHKVRHRIIIGTASIGLVLVLTGCDSRTASPDSTQVSTRTAKGDKNAPLEQRVRALVVEQLRLKTTPKATDRLVEDLGADSLDCVELVMAMEEEFRIAIPDEEAVKMKTLADMVAYLEKSASASENAAGLFQMRLVLDEPSVNSERLTTVSPKGSAARPEALNIEKHVLLDQTALKSAIVATDQFGSAQINLAFTDAGRKQFAEITKSNVRKRLAIVIGGRLYSAPTILHEITGGEAIITGNFTIEEAKALAGKITEKLAK